jgi:hypothetical protein
MFPETTHATRHELFHYFQRKKRDTNRKPSISEKIGRILKLIPETLGQAQDKRKQTETNLSIQGVLAQNIRQFMVTYVCYLAMRLCYVISIH